MIPPFITFGNQGVKDNEDDTDRSNSPGLFDNNFYMALRFPLLICTSF